MLLLPYINYHILNLIYNFHINIQKVILNQKFLFYHNYLNLITLDDLNHKMIKHNLLLLNQSFIKIIMFNLFFNIFFNDNV